MDRELFEQELAELALSPNEKYILIAIASVVGLFVIYFEVRYMRGKSKEVRKAAQKKDEAYNAVLTTRSVVNVMQRRGVDTRASQGLVDSAKSAMQRGDYEKCMTLCEQARKELTNPTQQSEAPATKVPEKSLEAVAEDILETDAGPSSVNMYSGSKLPADKDGNYLSAKFELGAAKTDIRRAVDLGGDTSEAQNMLTEAEGAFVVGNYSKALSLAVRARKAVSAEAASETIPLRRKEQEEPELEEAPGEISGAPRPRCKECTAPLEPGDVFCGSCGAKVLVERICENCGAKSRSSDKFCRKCGASLV